MITTAAAIVGILLVAVLAIGPVLVDPAMETHPRATRPLLAGPDLRPSPLGHRGWSAT